jgi:transposase InsO family protein
MPYTAVSKTTGIMRSIFVARELPEMVVSDNGPSFEAKAFKTFLKRNCVKQTFQPPYYANG